MYKSKVLLESEDGKQWLVSRIDYLTEGKEYGKKDFVEQSEGSLKTGNVLVKK
jgi:hypothetical protein